jgi:hypothetical protein
VKMAEGGKSVSNAQAPPPRRLAFTFDASSGEIVKTENVDSAGQRRELSKAERQELAKEGHGEGVEALLERAFEAGIASLLDDEDGKEDESETEDEAAVRRILLKPLMERTFAARALRREVLRRAIVQSLIQDVVSFGESESEPPKAQKSDRAAPRTST